MAISRSEALLKNLQRRHNSLPVAAQSGRCSFGSHRYEASHRRESPRISCSAAHLFVKMAASFQAQVEILKGNEVINGKSILDLLTLGAGNGTTLTLRANGPDAQAAVEALARLIEGGFGEVERPRSDRPENLGRIPAPPLARRLWGTWRCVVLMHELLKSRFVHCQSAKSFRQPTPQIDLFGSGPFRLAISESRRSLFVFSHFYRGSKASLSPTSAASSRRCARLDARRLLCGLASRSRRRCGLDCGRLVPAFHRPQVCTFRPAHRPRPHLSEQERVYDMKKEMLINVSQPEECRIAIVEDGLLEELYIERSQPEQLCRQYLQGPDRQPGAQHPGGVRRFRRRPQWLSAHQRRRAAVFSPGRLRSRRSDAAEWRTSTAAIGPDRRCRRAATKVTTMADRRRRTADAMAAAATRRTDRGVRSGAATASACGRDSSRRSRRSSAAATKCSCRSSRKASAPRGRRSRPTSAFPAATWC